MAHTSHVEAEVEIDRPVAEVFETSTDVSRWSDWQTRFVEAEQTSPGAFGAGTSVRTVSEAMGRRYETQSQVTEFVADQAITLEGASEAITYTSTWSFEETTTGGCRLVVRMDAKPREGAVLVKLIHPWLTRVFRKRLEADLEALKVMLEADNP